MGGGVISRLCDAFKTNEFMPGKQEGHACSDRTEALRKSSDYTYIYRVYAVQ